MSSATPSSERRHSSDPRTPLSFAFSDTWRGNSFHGFDCVPDRRFHWHESTFRPRTESVGHPIHGVVTYLASSTTPVFRYPNTILPYIRCHMARTPLHRVSTAYVPSLPFCLHQHRRTIAGTAECKNDVFLRAIPPVPRPSTRHNLPRHGEALDPRRCLGHAASCHLLFGFSGARNENLVSWSRLRLLDACLVLAPA